MLLDKQLQFTDNFLIYQSIKTHSIFCVKNMYLCIAYTQIYTNVVYSTLGYMGKKSLLLMQTIKLNGTYEYDPKI